MIPRESVLSAIFCGLFLAVAKAEKEKNDYLGFSLCDPSKGSIFDYEVETLEGRNVSVGEHAGNTLLVVNVATY